MSETIQFRIDFWCGNRVLKWAMVAEKWQWPRSPRTVKAPRLFIELDLNPPFLAALSSPHRRAIITPKNLNPPIFIANLDSRFINTEARITLSMVRWEPKRSQESQYLALLSPATQPDKDNFDNHAGGLTSSHNESTSLSL